MSDDHNGRDDPASDDAARDEPASDDAARDEELLGLLSAALTEDGELLPTDEAEVMRAELQGVEDVELPSQLEELPAAEPKTASPIDLAERRRQQQSKRASSRGWLSHAGAAILGAAAVLALVVAFGDEVSRPLGLGTDPATTSATAEPEPIRVDLPTGCAEDCCAGADCAAARAELANCPSGRSCVPCTRKLASLYRLRVGAVHPAEAGRAVLESYPQGQPELCVRIGASDERCVPTLLTERTDGAWRTLPLVAASEDLGAKASIRLRWKGVKEPLATAARWTSPVAVTPTSLCKGYAVKLESADGELFGSVSLFLDNAHHVILARSAEVAPLQSLGARLELSGLEARIYETTASGAERFALAFGPFDADAAERVRWQLLAQGQNPIRIDGLDHLGEPQPLP